MLLNKNDIDKLLAIGGGAANHSEGTSKKDKDKLPDGTVGADNHSEGTSKNVSQLLNNAEKCLEIENEFKMLQAMSDEAKELNRSAAENRESLATAVRQLNDTKSAVDAATKSANAIVDNINDAVSKAERTSIKVCVTDETQEYLEQQIGAYLKEEEKLMKTHRLEIQRMLNEHQKKMRKIAESSGGLFLSGWTAKLAIGSYIFFCIYYCITLLWFGSR